MARQWISNAALVTLFSVSAVPLDAQAASPSAAPPYQFAQNQAGVSGGGASASVAPMVSAAARVLAPGTAAGTAVAGLVSDPLRDKDTAKLIASALAGAASTTTTTTTTTSTGR